MSPLFYLIANHQITKSPTDWYSQSLSTLSRRLDSTRPCTQLCRPIYTRTTWPTRLPDGRPAEDASASQGLQHSRQEGHARVADGRIQPAQYHILDVTYSGALKIIGWTYILTRPTYSHELLAISVDVRDAAMLLCDAVYMIIDFDLCTRRVLVYWLIWWYDGSGDCRAEGVGMATRRICTKPMKYYWAHSMGP